MSTLPFVLALIGAFLFVLGLLLRNGKIVAVALPILGASVWLASLEAA